MQQRTKEQTNGTEKQGSKNRERDICVGSYACKQSKKKNSRVIHYEGTGGRLLAEQDIHRHNRLLIRGVVCCYNMLGMSRAFLPLALLFAKLRCLEVLQHDRDCFGFENIFLVCITLRNHSSVGPSSMGPVFDVRLKRGIGLQLANDSNNLQKLGIGARTVVVAMRETGIQDCVGVGNLEIRLGLRQEQILVRRACC